MTQAVIHFVVIALVCALGLWALAQFPTLDGTVVRFIRIAVFIVLSILLIDLILTLLFHQGLSFYLGASH